MKQRETDFPLIRGLLGPATGVFVAALALSVVLVGCAPKVGVSPIDDETWFRRMHRSALNSTVPSERTVQFLRQQGLLDSYHRKPIQMLTELAQHLCSEPNRETVFALAELCYLEAKRHQPTSEHTVRLYLSSALYAYAYLFDVKLGPLEISYDPRFRLACDLYNRSLAKLGKHFQDRNIRYTEGLRFRLLRGDLYIEVKLAELAWTPSEFDRFRIAYDYQVEGLNNHNRTFGLGVPLIVLHTPPAPEVRIGQDRSKPQIQRAYAATLVLFVKESICDKIGPDSTYRATARVYDPMQTHQISIGSRVVPLETDFTTPIAYMLDRVPPPKRITGMFDAKALAEQKGLYLGQPYQRGKIPIVFVHGLMSSPLAWLEMINDLMEDPQIRQRYQFWFFLYPTGNPILFSASVLRDSLLEARRVFDPEGKDPAFDQMVLVGHSMGGLLSKMVVQQSDDLLWKMVSDRPIEHLDITVEQRALLERMLFFEPLPFVSRIVFIAVPHRGSKLVRKPIVETAISLVKPAAKLVRLTTDVIMALVEDADTAEDLLAKHMPTGVGDLRPDNPVLQTIAELPMNPDVTYHSIIGNYLAADTPGGTDTVVPYESSRLEGAASERIVQSDHSVQKHPLAILEVKRILLEHLATIDRDKR